MYLKIDPQTIGKCLGIRKFSWYRIRDGWFKKSNRRVYKNKWKPVKIPWGDWT